MAQNPLNISNSLDQASAIQRVDRAQPANSVKSDRWHPRVDQGSAVGKSDEIPLPSVQTGVKPFKLG